ncbi:unnamed protein product [Danaus chrysippus]|uniref:(African queen) hypothetical protein n=1 Tax=Danaus chrysippus TaxID=151541 RepID=A0A8J2QY78_9NEOP|nr:unnamed protein product [Danaus chrysippus]
MPYHQVPAQCSGGESLSGVGGPRCGLLVQDHRASWRRLERYPPHMPPRYRATDRADIFADYLETQFQPYPAEDTQHVEEVEQTVDEYLEQAIAPTEDPIIITPGQFFSRFAVLSSGRPRS